MENYQVFQLNIFLLSRELFSVSFILFSLKILSQMLEIQLFLLYSHVHFVH